MNHWTEELLRCPECGHIAELRNWDVAGADDGNLFCNQCNAEVIPEDVEPEPDHIVTTEEEQP